MTRYAQHVAATPQTEQQHKDQRPNNAGGYSFTLDKWKRLDRFLIIGAEGGTYYVKERELARDNAKCIEECVAEDGARTVARIAEISLAGRAPKNEPAVFALALAASSKDAATAKLALSRLPDVCRIGTHLFQFCASINALRGWGRGLRRAVGAWYNGKPPKDLAYQVLKYQQRAGWSHRDVLRLCHAAPRSPAHGAIMRWATTRELGERSLASKDGKHSRSYAAIDAVNLPSLLSSYERLTAAEKASEVVALIREHGYTHEMVPSQHKASPDVWAALLEHMPLTATIRNLGKMTSVGLLAPMSEAAAKVASGMTAERIRKARVHPIAILQAIRTYSQGHGEKGSLTWSPVGSIVDALNEAFYLAFESIEPTKKATMLALDISGSMGGAAIGGMAGLTARDVSAAMAMATARTEERHMFVGFSHNLIQLPITPKQRLDDVVRLISNLPFGATDCGLPMRAALAEKIPVETFVVYTDSETYAGGEHPHVSLENYRQKTGINAKLIVCGTTATEFTIANPNDPGMLDVVGFSSDCPAVLAEFAKGD